MPHPRTAVSSATPRTWLLMMTLTCATPSLRVADFAEVLLLATRPPVTSHPLALPGWRDGRPAVSVNVLVATPTIVGRAPDECNNPGPPR